MGDHPSAPHDPAERYYSAPPPSGVRERLSRRRGAIIGGVVVLTLATGIPAGALLLSGDGKGSGDIERAFGRVSPQDERLAADAAVHHAGVYNGIIAMVRSGTTGDLSEATAEAEQTLGSLDRAALVVDRIDNEPLRRAYRDITLARRDFVRSYDELATYLLEHPGKRRDTKARALAAHVDEAGVDIDRADRRLITRIKPYMTAKQRSAFRESQQRHAQRFADALGQ
jgi:hypothetical protein